MREEETWINESSVHVSNCILFIGEAIACLADERLECW